MVSASFAETSMFGAGDLNSSNPYGLSKTEEVIVKNKKNLVKTEQKIKKTTTKVDDLNERVGGLESLLEGESLKLNKTYISLNKHLSEYKLYTQNTTKDITRNKDKILSLELQIDEDMDNIRSLIAQNTKNIQTLKKSFDKIAKLTNEINNNYISKKEFDKLISLLDDKPATTVKSTPKKTKKVASTKSSEELLLEAKAFFKRDYFTNALPIFEDLVSKNYKPAESNFYIGEIKYYRKKYKDALHYFKTSMTLYDKASYLPKLLLHSAISFEKLGDNDNAQNFYNTLIDIYPESNEAKEASKKIKI